ncbi:MAG: hypothetical protein Q8928_10370 [Bacteroidota bacterium]|nr:hypothetical protein [Bacteroidota bacterium]
MLKAGALYYAIMVSFLVALLSGFLLLSVWFHHYHTMYQLQGLRLERNVSSAITMAIEAPGITTLEQTVSVDLFNDEENVVNVTKKQWGGFYLLKAEAAWQKLTHSAIAMCGMDIFCDDSTALYLADKERYLSISGSTLLNGNCYIPKLGIRRAYIEGKSYTGDELIHGKTQTSKSNLPEPDPLFTSANKIYLEGNSFPNDSMLSILRLEKADTFVNSFYRKTVVFYSSQWITIGKKIIKGNVKIVSDKGITMGNKAEVKDIIVYAPKIETESGFSGTLQMFARDTLIVREGTRLKFPSLIGIVEATCKNPLIDIKANSQIAGDVILLTSKTDNQPEVIIGENAEINGRIYCDGRLQLKGKVYGGVYCKGFVLKTATSVYENHLLDVTIDFQKLSKYYSGSGIFKVTDRYKMIQWAY